MIKPFAEVEMGLDFTIARLGDCQVTSPMRGVRFVEDHERVLYPSTLNELHECQRSGNEPPAMESAGPRARLFFDVASMGQPRDMR